MVSGVQFALVSYLLIGLPLVALLAWWLKRRYAAAVVRLQSAGAREPDRANTVQTAEPPAPPVAIAPLQIVVRAAADVRAVEGVGRRTDAPTRLRWRVLTVQAVGELIYWSVLILLMVVAVTGQVPLALVRMILPVLLAFVVPPVAVAWAVQSGLPRRLMTFGSLMLVVYAVTLVWSDPQGWSSQAGFSFGYAAIAVAMSAFLRPTVRGAGIPLAAAGLSAWLSFSLLFALALALEGPDDAPDSLAEIVIGVTELLGMSAVSLWCGWRTFATLATRYAAKRFSDIQLALALYATLLTVWVMASLASETTAFAPPPLPRVWIAVAAVGLWGCWRLALRGALRAIVRAAPPSAGPLLLLRVFRSSWRSEAFTERFFAHWRFASPVWMIAGPDLAGAYLEPHEFYGFLRGRLRDQFVTDPAAAPQKVSVLDPGRDPDGRFRVTELYCTANTWQPTVLEMMARAGVILLDLREYSDARQGARYELTELLRRARLAKVIVLVDGAWETTDTIEAIWREVAPFRADQAEPPRLTVMQFRAGSVAEMNGLFQTALAIAAPASA